MLSSLASPRPAGAAPPTPHADVEASARALRIDDDNDDAGSGAPAAPARPVAGEPAVEASPAPAADAGGLAPRVAPPPAGGPPPAPDPVEPAAGFARLAVEVELFARAAATTREGSGALTQLRLDRGEVGVVSGLGAHAAAELRLEALRSAGDGGALGIDGDTLIMRVKRAALLARGERGDLRLDAAVGLAMDPWLATLDTDDPTRPLSPSGSERLLGWPSSDLSAVGRAELGPARATLALGNGEGLRYPERNRGKTTTAVLVLAPWRWARLAAVVRDGSVGPGLVRERRLGGAVRLGEGTSRLRGSLEVVRALGLGDRGDAAGVLLAGWAEARVAGPWRLAARAATLGYDRGGRTTTVAGAAAFEAIHGVAGRRLRLWLVLERLDASGDAGALPGADAGTATTASLLVSATAPFFER